MSRRGWVASALGVAVLVLAGCGAGSGSTAAGSADGQTGACPVQPGAMAFVVGGRANTPAIGSNPAPILFSTTEAAVSGESSTAIVDTGGRPAVQRFDFTLQGNNGAAQEVERQKNTSDLQNAILRTAATAPEADPLEALHLAAEHVRANGSTGTIVMVDSGLQTTGALDYTTPGMLAATPTDVVTSLQSAGQLPDLHGISVILVGVGSTAPPQGPLDAATRHTVQEQWRAIATAAGATCVGLDSSPSTTAATAALPAVTPVEVPEVRVSIPTAEAPAELALQFQSNSDRFVDAAAAQESLKPLAGWLTSTGTAVLLTGTTASDGDEAGRIRLSSMRADAAKAVLVALGADAAQITTEGVGTDHPSHVDDIGPEGELLPGPAARNRLVIVSVASA